MAEAALVVESVPLDRLFPSPANPRKNDAAVDHVAASIRRFGFRQPLVATRSGEVIAGNTRWKAAQKLGIAVVPVVWFDGTNLEATAYGIADNRTHEFSEWDDVSLAKLLQELRNEDALDGVGFASDDIDRLLREVAAGGGNQVEDQGPEDPLETPVTKRGDLWILGEHRLLCGDSTSAEDVSRVLDGETAGLLSTDPPYCVDYTGNDRPTSADGKSTGKDWSHLYNEVDIKDLGLFLDGVMRACLPRIAASAPIYVWHAHVQQPTIAAVFERHGILLHQVLVWNLSGAPDKFHYLESAVISCAHAARCESCAIRRSMGRKHQITRARIGRLVWYAPLPPLNVPRRSTWSRRERRLAISWREAPDVARLFRLDKSVSRRLQTTSAAC